MSDSSRSMSLAPHERTEQAERNCRDQVRDVLDRLRAHLAITDSDLARMLGVSVETLQERVPSSGPVTLEWRARVGAAGAALDRLLGLFKPESLPQVVRREAELFGGQRALDWILEGRIAEVADRYDMALSYQA